MKSPEEESSLSRKFMSAREAIRDALDRKEYCAGDRLPGERALSKKLGIAPMTLRRAVDGLVEEGLLERKPGSGTYVREHPGAGNICLLAFHVEHMAEGGAVTNNVLDALRAAIPDTGCQIRGMILPSPLPPVEQTLLELRAMRAGIVAILSHRNSDYAFVKAITDRIPSVLLFKGLAGLALPTVKPDTAGGIRQAVDYLQQRGRRRIGLLDIDADHEQDVEISHALQAELQRRNLSILRRFWLERQGSKTVVKNPRQRILDWVAALLDSESRPDALISTVGYMGDIHDLLAARGMTPGRDLDTVLISSIATPRALEYGPVLSLDHSALAEEGGEMVARLLREGGEAFADAPYVVRPTRFIEGPDSARV